MVKRKKYGLLCGLICCFIFATAGLTIGLKPHFDAGGVFADGEETPAGFTSATLTRVNAYSSNEVSGVQSICFDDYSAKNAYFLIDYYGKNVPNFAVRATEAVSTWSNPSGNNVKTEGIFIGQSGRWSGETYGSKSLLTGFGTTHSLANHLLGEAGKGPGILNMEDGVHYISIIGYQAVDPNQNDKIVYYLFRADDTLNSVELLTQTEMTTKTWGLGEGTKVVIYPNVGAGPNEISFSYVRPYPEIEGLIRYLDRGYAFKEGLLSALNLANDDSILSGNNFATLSRVYATSSNEPAGIESICFDDYSADNAYFLIDYYGKNMPNFAVRATEAVSSWSNKNNIATAGIFIGQSGRWAAWSPTSLTTTFGTGNSLGARVDGEAGKGPGILNMEDGVHYISIIGYQKVDNFTNDKLVYYLFKADDNLKTVQLLNKIETTTKTHGMGSGKKLVIYPNMTAGPEQIRFKYANPASTLKDLLSGINDEYSFKGELLRELEYKTVTIKDVGDNVLGVNIVEGDTYVLPDYFNPGVVGYDFGGDLYKSGQTISVSESAVVKEVALNLELSNGVYLRLVNQAGHMGGMRFIATADADVLNNYGDKIRVFGMIAPTDEIQGEFDGDGETAITQKLDLSVTDGNVVTYNITFTDVLYTNYNRKFSVRAFAEIDYLSGTERVYSDYSEQNNSRSIYQVACTASNVASLSDYEKEILTNYTAYTVTIVKNGDNYSIADASTDGLSAEFVRNYTVSGNTITISNISETLKATLDKKAFVPVTVYEGSVVTRYLVPVVVDGNSATGVLSK